MTVEEMTAVDQREVDRRVRRCRLRQWLGWAAYALVAIHLLWMILSSNFPVRLWVSGYKWDMLQICMIITHFVVLFILALVAKTGSVWIYGALQKECAPFLVRLAAHVS